MKDLGEEIEKSGGDEHPEPSDDAGGGDDLSAPVRRALLLDEGLEWDDEQTAAHPEEQDQRRGDCDGRRQNAQQQTPDRQSGRADRYGAELDGSSRDPADTSAPRPMPRAARKKR